MESAVAKQLASYGALGILALVSIWWAVKMHLEARSAQRQKELLLERYVTKAETWMEKYHELARELKALVKALRRGGDEA